MGPCVSKQDSNPIEQEGREQSKKIEQAFKKEAKSPQALGLKLLLLGAGDSGKSTFAKQLGFIYGDLLSSTSYAESFIPSLRENCLHNMRLVVQVLEESGTVIPNGLDSDVQKVKSASALTPVVANSIFELWNNKQIKEFIQRIDDSNLEGGYAGAEYFFENGKRFAENTFRPTKSDILAARVKTTGVSETKFTVQRTNFTVIDVGGQRSERKKWLNHFHSVSAVIFLTAINEYDMVLSEDSKTNRLLESLVLWKALSSSQFFQKTPFILFLNKSDLFKIKITQVPLSDVFSDYDEFVNSSNFSHETSNFEKGCHYMRSQFQKHFDGYIFYFHVTNARDTEVCQKVFNIVQKTILDEVMKAAGIMNT